MRVRNANSLDILIKLSLKNGLYQALIRSVGLLACPHLEVLRIRTIFIVVMNMALFRPFRVILVIE